MPSAACCDECFDDCCVDGCDGDGCDGCALLGCDDLRAGRWFLGSDTRLFTVSELVRRAWSASSSSDLYEWVEIEPDCEPEPPCTIWNSSADVFDIPGEVVRRGLDEHELTTQTQTTTNNKQRTTNNEQRTLNHELRATNYKQKKHKTKNPQNENN